MPQQKMGIHGQYVEDLSFENPNSPFLSSSKGPHINVMVNINSAKLEGTKTKKNVMNNFLNAKTTLNIDGKSYNYFSLNSASEFLGTDATKLPCSLKVLLENSLRNEDGVNVKLDDIRVLADCVNKRNHEISYKPARMLMQDFTGVPAVVDLASMRSYVKKNGGNPSNINSSVPVDLVIDHSVQVDNYGSVSAFSKNVELEVKRNLERYQFLKWGESSFTNFRVVLPGTGICHQMNLEYLAKVVCNNDGVIYPDTLVGTDNHTTMVNGLSVLGWGVGGIEAESVMLGQPISMVIPEVVGFKLIGRLSQGVTATGLVLTVTNILRIKGVVGKFVEFYGDGLDYLSLADRATIANMAPEYGAACGFFPIDQKMLDYLSLTGRPEKLIKLVEAYAKEQGLWRSSDELASFDTLELDLSSVEPVMAGPKRPQDKVFLSQVAESFSKSFLVNELKESDKLQDGSVVIAAMTSCTNTSNPSVMIAAGLVARNAIKLGVKSKPWVKTSLAPGSQVVTEYLEKSGLQVDLNALGFNLVGYGCTTCIGNSGPLNKDIEDGIKNKNLTVAAVLSGNRNFEGRIHPLVKANYLASPPLVVAYALAGTVQTDLTKDSICKDKNGNDVYLKDRWPTNNEIEDCIKSVVTREMFIQKYKDVFSGDEHWRKIKYEKSEIYNWDANSTYIQNPPHFDNLSLKNNKIDIKGAQILAMFGDSVTTDHICPAGNIASSSPADPLEKAINFNYEPHPGIPLPQDILGPERNNSLGMDISDSMIVSQFADDIKGFSEQKWQIGPIIDGKALFDNAEFIEVVNPAHLENVIEEVSSATSDQALNALEIAHSAFAKWQNVSAEERAKCLEKAADLLEERMKELIYILIVEAGKILSDAIAEVREAIDFLRYYAMIAKNELSDWKKLPSPTGEDNFIFFEGRGVFLCISP
uniref:aconitate hydratase n=1 Tax=Glossina morsitans morsitans TaxID=37546 RepID=A0A1B0G4B6_GLOMM